MVNRIERLALLALLVLGAWLRFQHLGAIEYNIDQAYPIWQGLSTLRDGTLPLAGQGTSVLFANPTLTGYFFVPALALIPQPIGAYLITLMLNTFAIWLAYRGLRWLIGIRPALVGAALFAINPWIIEDSRRTWVQSLLPFFVCLIFWALASLLTGQTQHPRRRLLIALIGLALVANTYLLAYALAAPVGLLLLIFWRRLPKRSLLIGGALLGMLALLYGIGLARDWENTQRRADQFSSGESHFSDEALNHAVRLVTGSQYVTVRGNDAPADDENLRQDLSQIAHLVWFAALLTGIGLASWKILNSSPLAPSELRSSRARGRGLGVESDSAVILLIWFLLPILMMSYVSRVVHPFYMLLSVPAGHGLAAWALDPLLRRPKLAGIAAAAVLFTAGINGVNTVRFAQETAAHPGRDWPTLPLADATALGQRIREAPHEVVFSALDEWTPSTLAGDTIRTKIWSQYGSAVLVPENGGLYILFSPDLETPIIPPIFTIPSGKPLVLDDGSHIELWHTAAPDPAQPAAIPSDADLSLAGWTLDGDLIPGSTATLTTYWHVDHLHPERGIWTFAPYAHITAPNGQVIVNVTGDVIPPLIWAEGDLLIQQSILTIPANAAEPLALTVGLYDSVRSVNAIFRLSDTEYAADISLINPS